MSKRISKANQTHKRAVYPKDEVQGINKLLGSYPDFKLKDIPQGLGLLDNSVDFLVDNSPSTVPYPKIDVGNYFQTSEGYSFAICCLLKANHLKVQAK